MGKTQSWFLRDPVAGDRGSKLQTGLVSSAREDREPAVPLGGGHVKEHVVVRACQHLGRRGQGLRKPHRGLGACW